MSTPAIDLSKVQYTSLANSFKNDNVYTGSLSLSASIPAGSFLTATSTVTIAGGPQFSMFYGFYQEAMDMLQQANVGSGYNAAAWYLAGVNNQFGARVTSGQTTVISGMIYPVINGNTVTVTALLNNPYGTTLTYNALTIPWCLFCYSTTS